MTFSGCRDKCDVGVVKICMTEWENRFPNLSITKQPEASEKEEKKVEVSTIFRRIDAKQFNEMNKMCVCGCQHMKLALETENFWAIFQFSWIHIYKTYAYANLMLIQIIQNGVRIANNVEYWIRRHYTVAPFICIRNHSLRSTLFRFAIWLRWTVE